MKDNVWDIDVALHESRAQCAALSKKVAGMEREIRLLTEQREEARI